VTERERAFLVLQRVERFGSNASALLAREGPFVREAVRGVFRWRSRLDFIASQLSRRSIARIDQPALQILRLALYELLYMKSAPHAVVHEAVALAKRHASRARGFVNAVLRKAAAANAETLLPPEGHPDRSAIELAHPPWLLEKWSGTFGHDRARQIAEANQQHSHADLLVNPRKNSIEQAEQRLRARGLSFSPSPFLPELLRLEGSSVPLREEIAAGLFHPMDEGSALIASLIGDPARKVLDVAAAPGGKSLFLTLKGHAVVSHDKALSRLGLVRSVFARCGIEKHSVVNGDGTSPPFRRRFDAVLLDAPCSASGIIRKNPEIKWRLDPDCFARYAELQRALLTSALDFAESECVYATCSLEPEENDAVVQQALRSRSDFSVADLTERLSPFARRWVDGGILRLTPESGADGFTAFLLRRK
jgi:16S rRNA (cytosine967-C5)-methyltransferase